MPIPPLTVDSYTLTNALGPGRRSTLDAMREGRSGLRPCDLQGVDLNTWIGRVEGVAQTSALW